MTQIRNIRNASPYIHAERACGAVCPAVFSGGASLLFEQGLQRLFGLLSPVDTATCLFGAPLDIVVAEIGPLLIDNAFGRDFLTFIVSALVVKVTLLTTAKISVAMGTGILSAHLTLDRDHIPAKDTIHYPCSSYPN